MGASDVMTTSRVVDRANQGWHVGEGVARYTADYGERRGLEDRTYVELLETRGPLRPVLPVAGADWDELERVLTMCGPRSVATVAAAVEHAFYAIREERGGVRARYESYEAAERTLTAGGESSSESALLMDVVSVGRSLNVARQRRGLFVRCSTAIRRAAGPSARVDSTARGILAGMIYRWVTDPERYTDVPSTLASVVSSYCDSRGLTWDAIGDSSLWCGSTAPEFRVCYGLLYSRSVRFDRTLVDH